VELIWWLGASQVRQTSGSGDSVRLPSGVLVLRNRPIWEAHQVSVGRVMLHSSRSPKIVSERLGHSRVAITLDLYSGVTPTMQQQAVEAMDRLLA